MDDRYGLREVNHIQLDVRVAVRESEARRCTRRIRVQRHLDKSSVICISLSGNLLFLVERSLR